MTILCDIGNTTVDIFENDIIRKVLLSEFHPDEYDGDVWYACVNSAILAEIFSRPNWHNISTLIDFDKYYSTMGIDRILVCEAVDDGVIIDAGSAITVDQMCHGSYKGGFISLGLHSAQDAYARLSPALSMSFNFEVDLTIMANNTPDAITVGFLAPLINYIKSLEGPLYLTGGDAKVLSVFFEDIVVDEELLFKGMKKLIQKGSKC